MGWIDAFVSVVETPAAVLGGSDSKTDTVTGTDVKTGATVTIKTK